MRTIDRIRLQGIGGISPRTQSGADQLTSVCREFELPIFVIDNVAHYVYRQADRGIGYVIEDFPCVAPVRPMFFMEWVNSTGRERRGVLVQDLSDPDCVTDDAEEEAVREQWMDAAKQDARENGYEGEFGWVISLCIVIQSSRKQITGPYGWMVLALDPRGRVMGNRYVVHPDFPLSGTQEQEAMSLLLMTVAPLQAISFLHCKNVKVDTVTQPPKLSAKYKRRTGRPLTEYQQIRLEVPRRAGSGGGKGGGDDRRLHIVDGHFAYYGDHHGPTCPPDHPPHGLLFGKLEGQFWVDYHARGNPERGKVHTDRELVLPEDTDG